MLRKMVQIRTKALDPLFFAFLFLFLFLLPLRLAQGAEPVSLEVLLDGVPALGGGWVLTLTLEALVDLAHAEIHVTSSKGLKLGAGKPFWQGRLDTGDEEVLETAYNLTHLSPQEITIRIIARSSDGKTFEKIVKRKISVETP